MFSGFFGQLPLGSNRAACEWWTGEDSNLRSPQGAADLQSAGFSHSPTRPHGKIAIEIERAVSIRGETPARLCYSRRKQSVLLACYRRSAAPTPLRFQNQLAEGFEPPTL